MLKLHVIQFLNNLQLNYKFALSLKIPYYASNVVSQQVSRPGARAKKRCITDYNRVTVCKQQNRRSEAGGEYIGHCCDDRGFSIVDIIDCTGVSLPRSGSLVAARASVSASCPGRVDWSFREKSNNFPSLLLPGLWKKFLLSEYCPQGLVFVNHQGQATLREGLFSNTVNIAK